MSTNDKFDELIGQVIGDRYKVLSVVGVGGMSVVFKAEDTEDGKTVAIKVLNECSDANNHAVKCFINESRAISMLSHENIVKVYDMSLEGDLKYIVMELADGVTLKEYMEEKEGKISLDEALNFTEQILLALEHAHEKGVIHRDIKPHNMIVLPDGKLKVTDFGIARAPGSDTISMSDKALGTVYYISPEQASGKETGTYSDIYSVGVMLYEMTTGKLPFDAQAPVSVAMMQISDDPQKPSEVDPEIPKGVEQVILKAMSKAPEDRFKSAKSMLRAIKILQESPMVIFTEKPKAEAKSGKASSKKKTKSSDSGSKAVAPKKVQITLFPIILGMVLSFFTVLIVSGIVVVVSLFNSEKEESSQELFVTIPSLVGKIYDDSVKEELEKEHFEVIEDYSQFDDAYEYGAISKTDPIAGEVKKIKNSTGTTKLTVYINPSPEEVVLPDYSLLTENDAKIKLERYGFTVISDRSERVSHDTVPPGYVIRTEPEAGAVVSTDEPIKLVVSAGKNLKNVIAMPKLVGKTKGQAMVDLKDFDVEYVTVSNAESLGTVVGQSVTPFTVICPEFCDKITIYVSDGQGKTGIDELKLYLYMPGLVGRSLNDARTEMYEFVSNGIKVTYLESPVEADVGIITDQSLEAGTEIPVNYAEEIIIYYGTGAKEPEVIEPEIPEVIAPVNPGEPDFEEPDSPIIPNPDSPEVPEAPTDPQEPQGDGPVQVV